MPTAALEFIALGRGLCGACGRRRSLWQVAGRSDGLAVRSVRRCLGCWGVRSDAPRTDPTTRDLQVLAACYVHGSQKAAAHCLGISYQTVKNHLTAAYRSLGVLGGWEAAVEAGWLIVPEQYRCHPDPATMDLPRPCHMAGG